MAMFDFRYSKAANQTSAARKFFACMRFVAV
jgi:hypothetical protein